MYTNVYKISINIGLSTKKNPDRRNRSIVSENPVRVWYTKRPFLALSRKIPDHLIGYKWFF